MSNLFLADPLFPNLTADHLQSAYDDMAGSYERNGCVYFGLDDRFLLEYCSHYLRYGSEYFQALAVRVDERANSDVKAFLESSGRPTVFVVNVPMAEITPNEVVSLASGVLTTWIYNYAHESNEPYKIDFGICLHAGLAPGLIVGHFCPEVG